MVSVLEGWEGVALLQVPLMVGGSPICAPHEGVEPDRALHFAIVAAAGVVGSEIDGSKYSGGWWSGEHGLVMAISNASDELREFVEPALGCDQQRCPKEKVDLEGIVIVVLATYGVDQ